MRTSLQKHMPYFVHLLRTSKMTAFNYLQKRRIRKGEKIFLGLNDQDRWVVEDIFKGKTGGFFVDLGAHDGISASNTYVLEKLYHWRGICIEANTNLFEKLVRERSCTCVNACVDKEEQSVEFFNNGAWGGIIGAKNDNNYENRRELLEWGKRQGLVEKTKTCTLAQILRDNSAPKVIDYMDMDIEGNEERTLEEFPFHEYIFLTLTIERASERLNSILKKNGYVFVTLRVGDSFYVHESLPHFDEIPKDQFRQVSPKPAPLEKNYVKKKY